MAWNEALLAEANPAQKARFVVRSVHRAALGTLRGQDGQSVPYVSLVLVVVDHGGRPCLLLSDLAEHTTHFHQDPQVSLLFDHTGHLSDPLTGARVTLQGRVEKVDDATTVDATLARFCRYHPSAAHYAGFGDFHLYRVDCSAAHLVAGFGDIHWIDAADLCGQSDDATQLVAAEQDIVDHINADHRDAIDLIATKLLGQSEDGWRMSGLDCDGWDLRRGGQSVRCLFEERVLTSSEARVQLVRQTKRARS